MKTSRISFGVSTCRNYSGSNQVSLQLCKIIQIKLDFLKSLSWEQLQNLPIEKSETYNFENKKIILSTFKVDVSSEKSLFVVQAFFATFRLPNYFSFAGIGKMFVDGLAFDKDGKVEIAQEELLYEFQ